MRKRMEAAAVSWCQIKEVGKRQHQLSLFGAIAKQIAPNKKNVDKAPVLQHQGLTFTCSAAPVASRCFRFPGSGWQTGKFSRQGDLSVKDIAHSQTCINNAKVINNNSVPALNNASKRNCFTGVLLMPVGKDLYLLKCLREKGWGSFETGNGCHTVLGF